MRNMESTPVRGSILANVAGIGKTLTVVILQYMEYLELVQRRQQHDQWLKSQTDNGLPTDNVPAHLIMDARPMLIICPSYLVTQQAREILSKFKNLLNIHVYHGTKTSAHKSIAAITLTHEEWDTEMKIRAAETKNPEVSSSVDQPPAVQRHTRLS
jgi:SNF2 family DNA or RNA helicase